MENDFLSEKEEVRKRCPNCKIIKVWKGTKLCPSCRKKLEIMKIWEEKEV